jgi:hypothetical protein
VRIKGKLRLIKSIIYISFDLWTSPNLPGIITVVAYFLDKDFNNRSLLIKMRRVRDSYNGENIIKSIIFILKEMKVISNLGYFITDNVTNNDIVIKIILHRLRPNINNFKQRRVRCLNYILNLATKAFLFNNGKALFKDVKINSSVFITTLKVKITRRKTVK